MLENTRRIPGKTTKILGNCLEQTRKQLRKYKEQLEKTTRKIVGKNERNKDQRKNNTLTWKYSLMFFVFFEHVGSNFCRFPAV